MKLIESKAEIIQQQEGLDGLYKHIETCGRIPYKSEDKSDGTVEGAKAFVDRMIKSNHCYDGNTEVLTEKGWIKFSEYDEQKIAVINSNLSFKGFEKPYRVIKESYTGKFYKYPTLGIEVTDGHRMFGVFRESKNDFYNNSQYSLFECNIPYKDNNGRQKTLGERMFKTPSCCVNPTDEDLKFELLGFWLGDGCYLPQTKNNITFHLKKHRKVEYLKHLCQKLDYTFAEGKSGYYRVVKEGIGEEFCTNFYKNGNKYIPPMYFPSIEAAYAIFKGLINSDGTIYGNTKCAFSNTSLPLIEWISSVGCLIGYNISEIGISRITTQDKPVYRVHILSAKYSINNDSRRSSSKVIITDKTQMSYCVTVSTGLIMVRGSNKVTTICGNCAVLEHGTVYLQTSVGINDSDFYEVELSPYSRNDLINGEVFVTTNLRVIIELMPNTYQEFLDKYMCTPTENHIRRYTFKVLTSIGVTREANRHRRLSILEQSTRYCNYSKDKFDNQISFCKPSWIILNTGIYKVEDVKGLHIVGDGYIKELANTDTDNIFIQSCLNAEANYMALINEGWSPQQARETLPLCTATEAVYTGFADDWRHFFDLRYFAKTGKPHPNMLELGTKMKTVSEEAGIWEDIMNKPSKFD